MRLSLPGEESKPFKIKNGDAIQFGVDRRGSNEADMTCVGTWAKHRNTQDRPAASSDVELLGGVGWTGITAGVSSTECAPHSVHRYVPRALKRTTAAPFADVVCAVPPFARWCPTVELSFTSGKGGQRW